MYFAKQPLDFIDAVESLPLQTQIRICLRLSKVAYYGRNPKKWNLVAPGKVAPEDLEISPQFMREAWAGFCIEIEGDQVDPNQLTETRAYPIIALRGKGRRQEFCFIPENFGRAARRTPRKLNLVRKPPASEGIEDAPAGRDAGHGSSPPLAALRQAAPEATTIQLASGRVIPLAAAIEHARTCAVLENSFVENKEVTKPKGNSSFLFLDELNAAIRPIFATKALAADTVLWNNILIILGGVPRQTFLAVVRAKVKEALPKEKRHKFREIGLLLDLAKEAAAEWKPFAAAFAEFSEHFKQHRSVRWACGDLGLSAERSEQWAEWIEEDEDSAATHGAGGGS